MAQGKGDRYLIERDERDIGGRCRITATFETWQAATAAWQLVEPDPNPDVFIWLLRVRGDDPPSHLNTTVVDCKVL